MTGLDAFDRDAEPQPPDRELGEIEQRIGTGTPLSERMASGRPRSRNSCSNAVIAGSSRVESSAIAERAARNRTVRESGSEQNC